MTASTSIPNKYLVPFAQGDSSRVEIPVTTADATRASQTLGFPPLTMQPPEVGGVPPQGEDFNGAMNQIARAAWWMLQGNGFPYDNTFATDSHISGYAKGAWLPRSDLTGYWLNAADNNATNPEATDGTATNWLPGFNYGSATVPVSAATTTVYPVTAAKCVLTFTGTLTANSIINVPAWAVEWLIINNTVAAGFSLTLKTATGSGVVLAAGAQRVRCDGTDVLQVAETIAPATQLGQPAQLAQVGHGQCRLVVTSTTNIRLNPFNGRNLIINGIPQQVPSSGVNLTNGSLSANTFYYIYAFMNSGVMALEASATGHSADATTGVEIKTGDATRTLVGALSTDSGALFQQSGANMLVISYFNRRSLVATNSTASGTGFNSSSFTEITSAIRVNFISWADEFVEGSFSGSIFNSTTGALTEVCLFLDGVAFGNLSNFAMSGQTISNVSVTSMSAKTVTENAVHVCSPFGRVSSGNGSLNASPIVMGKIRG